MGPFQVIIHLKMIFKKRKKEFYNEVLVLEGDLMKEGRHRAITDTLTNTLRVE